jgi:hypothetical protein
MIEAANRKPRRGRGKITVALFAATAALIGGTQALAPAPAAAVITDNCEVEWLGVCVLEGDPGGSDQEGEVIVINDTKPTNDNPAENGSCAPRPGYLCPGDPIEDPMNCVPKPGYLCPTFCPADQSWRVDSTCPHATKLIDVPHGRPKDCPLGRGKAELLKCALKRLWREGLPKEAWEKTRRSLSLDRVLRALDKCATTKAELENLEHFRLFGSPNGRGGAPYSKAAWRSLGYVHKEARLRDRWEAAHCDDLYAGQV